MHYYKRNIGDYHRKAGRLTMLEHGAYTLLIDACYDREKFPTKEQALVWCLARSAEEIAAVTFVLTTFFDADEDGKYTQNHIVEDLEAYHGSKETNKRIALEREEKRRQSRIIEHEACTGGGDAYTNLHLTNNHKPLTINQEPVTNIKPTAQSKIAPCPVEQIIQLYENRCTRLPRLRVIPDKTRSAISARWRQDNKFQSMEFWQGFFDYCNDNRFLSGQAEPRSGNQKPFRADLNWIVKPESFANIINEKYA